MKDPTRDTAVHELCPIVRVRVLNSSGVTTHVATCPESGHSEKN
jgi:hypothetical protein